MSSLTDVEGKVARAQRDVLRWWLDHHRSAGTNDLTLVLRLLKQRRVIWTCKLLALGLLLLPSFVVFGILRGAIWILQFARDLLAGNPVGKSRALRVAATLPNLVKSRALAWGLGVIVIALTTAGAVRATMHISAKFPERLAPEAPTSTRPAEILPTTIPTTTLKILRPVPSPSFSGFNVLRTTLAEPLSMPAMTVGEMMFIANPVALAPTEPDATATAPDAEEPLTATPKVELETPVTMTPKLKPKPKQKLAREEPQQQQQLPWWSRLRWQKFWQAIN